ncbi:MAG TPA: rhodanese-like domain-containing protein [Mycobacteriales bacterium]|nr:rhodanese-like domain-containing protein [Mycobacteriales bacterium]
MTGDGVPECEVADLPAGAVLLDVREDDEWWAGHAPGAVHVPMSALPARLADVPGGRELAVVCRVGSRSARVTGWLRAQGYDAVNVAGGMLAWAAAGRPLTTDAPSPPVVL